MYVLCCNTMMQVLTYFRVPNTKLIWVILILICINFGTKLVLGMARYLEIQINADNRATKKQVRNYFDRVDCTSYSYSDKNYMLQIVKIFEFMKLFLMSID